MPSPRIAAAYRRLALIGVLGTGLLSACEPAPRRLNADERRLLGQVGLDAPGVVEALESLSRPLLPFYGTDEEGEPGLTVGVSVEVPYGSAEIVLREIRAVLAGLGPGAFYSERTFGFRDDFLAIVASDDPYDYLGQVRTNGLARGLSHEDVIGRLRGWEEAGLRFDFVGGGHDWVAARFEAPSDDVRMGFLEELLDFCPDVVGDGTRGPTAEGLTRTRWESDRFHCWWRGADPGMPTPDR